MTRATVKTRKAIRRAADRVTVNCALRHVETLERRVLLSHTFTATEASAITSGLSSVAEWAGDLSQYDALSTTLPGVATSMGAAADLKDALHDQLYLPVANYLATANPTDTGLGTLLGTLSATVGNLTFTVSSTSGGEVSGANGKSYEFHLALSAQRTLANTPIDLGYQWHGLNINPDASGVVTLSAGATVGLTFGLGEGDYTAAPNAFYAKFDALSFHGDISTTGLNFGADVGIMGVSIVNGSVNTHATESFTVTDPDHDAAGAITLAELQGTSLPTLLPVPVKTGTSHILFPVQWSFDALPQPAGSNPKITLDSNDITNFYQTQMSYNSDFFPVLPFGAMTAADLLPAIQQITTLLAGISPLSTVNVPFVPTKSLSDVFGFTGVISSMSSSLGSGGVPAFHNVQTLESAWAGALGVSTAALSATYDQNTQTLTWHINVSKTNDPSTAPISLTAGLQPLNLSSSTGTVSLTTNASFDTLLGIHLVPKSAVITGGAALPANGQFTGTTTFQIAVGNDPAETLTVAGDPSNVGIDDLVYDFNYALIHAPNDLSYKIGVRRNGLRLEFYTKWDAPAKITLYADIHDPIVTALGFSNGQVSAPVDVNADVFLQNTSLSGNTSGTVSGVSATGRLGMLGVGVSGGSGTMYMAGGFQLAASSNPTAGSQVTAADLLANAGANPQSFIRQLTVDGHATMTLPMTVNAGFLSLPLSSSPTITVNWTHAPNPATLSLAYNADMGPLLDFTSIKAGDLTSSLGGISALLGLANGGSVLSQQLPLLDKSLADLLNLSSTVTGDLSGLSLAGMTIQQVGPAIATAFALPSGAVNVQMDGHLLRITFNVTASASGSQVLSLDLDKLVAELPDGNPVKGFLQGMSQLVAGGASGQIGYAANATLHVSAGVDLTDPTHPAAFIDDSTNASISLQVNGTNLSFGATMGPLGVKVQGGTAKIGATLDPATVDSAAFSIGVEPSVTHRYALSDINASTFTADLTGAIHAVLPLYFPLASNYVGNLDVSIADLSNIPGSLSITAPDIHQLGLNMDLSQNMDGLLEGLNQLLEQLQNSLGKQVLSTNLPLVGDKLGSAVDFIGGALRTNIYDKLKAAFDNAESTGGQDSIDVARQGLYAALGPAGLNVLPAGGFGNYHDIDVTVDGVDVNDPSFDPSTLINSTRIEYKLHLQKSATLVSVPLNFDLGLPALGLKGDGAIQLKAGYDINLWFGVDKNDGFFIDTSPGDNGTAPEVKLDLSASIPGATMTGNLLFLQLQLKDNPADPTSFDGSFSIDLKHAGDEVTLPQLPSLFDPSSIEAHLKAEAKVNLLIVTSFGGNAAFPSLHANFLMDWKFSPTDPDLSGSAPTIAFKNVQLDAGEFLSSFMAPIVDKLKAVIDPIAPVLDVLTSKIGFLPDGYNTLVDIADKFGLVEGADGIKALGDIAKVVEDYSKMTTISSGELMINLGDFDLGGADPRSPSFDPTTIDPNVTTDVGDVSSELPSDPATQTFWQDTQDLGGDIKMSFPFIENPKDDFKLLLGQDVNLFTLDLPAIHLGFKAGVSIPVYSVGFATVYLNLGGSLDVQGKVAFGYDTSGIRELITDPSHNPADVFDGFYISTRQNADGTGADMPFLSASGELKVGISVDACDIVEVGADGGLGFNVSAYLQDPNNDGKLHVNEMIQEAGEGFFSTVKITGSIYALFDAWVEIKIPFTPFHYTWELVDVKVTLVSVSSVHPGIQGDRFAPNTKRASAADIGVGPGIHLNGLSLVKPSEEDWFHFQLDRTDSIDISTQCVPGMVNTTTEVYDKNGNLLATTAGDSSALKTLTLENLAADEYFIHVIGDGVGTGYYSLAIDPSKTSTTHVYYVSPAIGSAESFYTLAPGFDGNDGLTPWTPMASVQALINKYTLGPTDLVLIDTGNYSDSVTIGTSVNGAIFAGSPRGSIYTDRDGSPEKVVTWNVVGGANNRITGIQFDYGGNQFGATAITLSGGHDNTVDHIQVRGYDTGIEDAATNDRLLNNQLNGDIGIQIDAGGTGTLIQGDNISVDGIGIEDDGNNVTISKNFIGHLTSQSSYGTGIEVQGAGAQILDNNVKQILNGIALDGAGGSFLISGNTLLGFGYTPGGLPIQHPYGIEVTGSGTVRITGNNVQQYDTGIGVTLAGAAIDGNTVLGGSNGIDVQASNVTVGPADPATQTGNLVYANSGIGIRIGSGLSGVQVFLNSVHDNGTGIDSSSTTNIYSNDVYANNIGISSAGGIVGPADWTTPNTVHDNTTGIWTGANTLVRFNRIYANQDGVVAASGDTIVHNLIYRNSAHGIVDTGHTNVSVISNTIYLTAGTGLQINGGSANTTVRNNIFEADGGGYDIYVATNSQVGFASDYNNLYRTGAGQLVWFEKGFGDLYDWQIEADLDLHSIGYIAPNPTLDDPQFADLASDNYVLKSTSTSIDSGDPASAYSLEPGPNGNNIDLGAYGNTTQATPSAASYVRIDYPNLYIDWEANRARLIVWHTYNVTGNVRLELWQEGGGKVADIATVAASSGSYLWSPGQSGISPDALKRYRIHVVSVSSPSLVGVAREFFSVPPASSNYYVNDGSTTGDEYTSSVGDNRNTGRSSDAPKADLLPILRSYPLSANDDVWVDTGNYIDVRNLDINYNVDVTKANPGTGLGDDQGFSVFGPIWHTATLDRANSNANTAHVDIDSANFVSFSHLTLLGGSAGVYVHDNSRNFSIDHVEVSSTGGDGVSLDAAATSSTLDSLVVHDNSRYGIVVLANIKSVTNSTVYNSGWDGIKLTNADGETIQGNTVYNSGQYGLDVSTNGVAPVLIGSLDLADQAGNIVHDNVWGGIYVAGSGVSNIIAGNVAYNQPGLGHVGIESTGSTDRISRNIAYGNDIGILAYGTGLVDRNRVYNNTTAGIEITSNPTVAYNYVSGNKVGIYARGGYPSITNNTFVDNAQAGVELDGVAAGYAASGTPPHPLVESNTIRQSAGGTGVLVTGMSTTVEIRNNILDVPSGGSAINVDSSSQVGFASDFNLFHMGAGIPVGVWQGVGRATLTQWRNTTYGDVNSMTGNPLFVNAAGGDLHLQSQHGSNHGGSFAPVLDGATHLPDPNPGFWTTDASTSSAIDRGDAALPFANEPMPNGNYANLGAESNTAMASQSPTSYVLVTSPSDGVVWPEAQTYNIQWRTQDTSGTVTIELREGGALVRTLAGSASNTGSFSWTLPSDLAPASDYTIRVTRNDGTGASGDSPSPFVIAPVTHTYYVATTGDDSNSGLDAVHPKSSIRGVFFSYHVGFGDTIQVAGGTYDLTTNIFLDPISSGITIAGSTDPGNPTILDRQNIANGSYVFQMTGASYVTLDHLTMTGANTAIYDGSSDTADHLTVSNDQFRDNSYSGISLGAATNSTFVDNTFQGDKTSTQSWHLSIWGDGNTIQGNTFTGHALYGNGVAIDATGARMRVLNNQVYDTDGGVQITLNAPSQPTAADLSYVTGNQVHDITGSGMYVSGYGIVSYNAVWNTNPSTFGGALDVSGVTGTIVAGNTVYGSASNGLYVSGAGLVTDNLAHDNALAGILGYCYNYRNLVVQGNTVHDNATGISFNGPILNNTIYDNSVQGILVSGSTRTGILNNTIYQPSGVGISATSGASNLDVRNTIIVVGGGAAYSIAADSQTGFTADYNIVNTFGSGKVAAWGATNFSTLANWSNTLGFDPHSLSADPEFIDAANGNFHLSNGISGGEIYQPASPAIDAGDPSSYYLSEPQPNGNRVNIGADGNTAQANPSASPAIQITSPAANDQLQQGQTYNITWQSVGLAQQAPVAFINAGGPALGKWSADNYDQFATSGSLFALSYAGAIDTSGLTNPAPQGVYQTSVGSYGTVLGYDLPVPDGTYTIRLHFAEINQYAYAGLRKFDIVLNGTTVQSGYDIITQTGGLYKADIRQYTVIASGGTGIHLRLNAVGSWSPCINGIELLAANPAGYADPRYNIDVSVDNGAHWSSVATNVAADQYGNGSYPWTAGPASDGNVALLRVTSANNGSVVAQTQPFQIAPSGHVFYINDGSTAGDEYTTAPGNDSNNGKLPNRPMATLSALLAAYSPHAGDTIYIDSGTYNLATNIVLTGAYSGVTIIGPTLHQAVFNRNNTGSGAYAFEINGASNVTLDHLTITGGYEGIHADYTYGTPNTGLTITNDTIYANYQYGINLQTGNNNAVITGNNIYGIPGSWPATTIQTYGINLVGTGNTLSGNIVHDSDQYGIYVSSSGANTISGNTVYNTVPGKGSFGIYAYGPSTITGNTVYGQTYGSSYSGDGYSLSNGAIATNNLAYGNNVGIYASGTGTVVSGNRVYNNSSQGLNVSPTVQTTNNTIYSNGIGIYISGTCDLVGHVSGNLVYANSTAGIQVYGVTLDTYTGAHLIITGNTIYQPVGDGIQITTGSKSIELRNNIVDVGAGYAMNVSGDSTTGLVSDYNLLYATGTGRLGRFSNTTFATLDDWYCNTLLDDHSVSADPLFISPAGADGILGYSGGADHSADDNFHLQPGSPAIDAGDPTYPYFAEPQPNGDAVNIGYDGNTAQAQTSPSPQIVLRNPSGHQRLTVGQPTTIRWGSAGISSQSPVALINCGGPTIGNFSANTGEVIGSSSSNAYLSVNSSGIIDPAPTSVYQTWAAANGGVGNEIKYLLNVPDGSYSLRLHFLDPDYYASIGSRKFDIRINGVTVRAGYDIFADAGGYGRVVQQTFTATASGGTGITLELVNQVNSAVISAIEVLRDNPFGVGSPTFNIQASTDGGAHFTNIATGLTVNHLGEGSYIWTPGVASSNAILRIASPLLDVMTQSRPIVIAPAGHDYYINDNSTAGDTLTTAIGNNANTGKSPDQPMASLQALLALYNPTVGDVVHVDAGSYSVVRNIILSAANNGLLIQGPTTGTALFTRSYNNGSVKTDVFEMSGGVANLTLDHLAITGADYGVWGPYDYYNPVSSHLTISNSTISGNTQAGVYLDYHNDFAAVTNSLIYGNLGTGITIVGNDATISGNTVRNNSYTNIAVSGYRELVQNNQVYGSSTGIADSGSSSTPGTLISGNTVHDNSSYGITTNATTTRVVGNTVYNQTASGAAGIRGTGQFTGNTVYNNYYGIAAFSSASNQSTVSGNRVFHNIANGISITGNGVVARNRVYSNPIGIEADGSTYSQFIGRIESNLVYANSNQAIQMNYGGASFNNYGNITVVPAQVTNNTIYQPVGDGIRLQNSSYVNIEDNIIQSNAGYGIYADAASQVSGITSDRNLMVRQNAPASRVGFWGGADRLTLADWQAATGQDAHSATTTDAKFINIVGADNVFAYDTTQNIDGGADDNFQLAAGSPAIDRGTEWAGTSTDILNHSRVDDPGTVNAGSKRIVASQLSSSFFNPTGGVSQGWSGSYTYWTLNLPFSFPFYDQAYSQVYVSSAGYLQFGTSTQAGDNSNSVASLTNYARIAPMWIWMNTSAVYVDTSTANQITIRWSGTEQNSFPYQQVNFSTTLYSNGSIRFEYGAGNSNFGSTTVGISAGDGIHYQLGQYNGATSLNNAKSLFFDRSALGFTDIGAYEFTGNSADMTPTAITAATPGIVYTGGTARQPINTITLSFSHAISAVDAIVAGLYDLRSPGPDGVYGTADDNIITLVPQYTADATTVTLNVFGGPLPQGNYRLTVFATSPRAMHDINGQVIDGDANSTAGGNFTRDFVMGPPDVAPAITVNPSPIPIDEGVPFAQNASFTDPDVGDSWTATVNYGDGSGLQSLTLNPDQTFSLSHPYGDNGTYTITVVVTDSYGLSDTKTITQVINEVAPTATLSNSGPISEGGTATVSFINPFDPSTADTASGYRYSYDLNNDGVFEISNSTQAIANVTASIATVSGSHVIHARISSISDGAYTDYTTALQVNNVAPAITAALDATVFASMPYAVSGSFTDPGTGETYTATIDYGDGLGAQPLLLAPDGTFQLSCTYAAAGAYPVTLTITDGTTPSTGTGTVTVKDFAQLSAMGVDFSAKRGSSFYGPIANFKPFDGTTTADYSVNVDFGDGFEGSAWVNDNGDGTFSVYASKTYYSSGTFTVTSTITDPAIGGAVVHSTAAIIEPTMELSAYDIYPTQLMEFNGSVGSAYDPLPGKASAYSVTIDWGDGRSSPGSVYTYWWNTGYYYLYGAHTYETPGEYPVQVTFQKALSEQPPQVLTQTATAYVDDAPLGGGGIDVSATALAPSLVPVASFYDYDPAGIASLYSASIDWGNGVISSGSVIDDPANPGNFLVMGTEPYQLADTYTINVHIDDPGVAGYNATLDVYSTATVSAAPLQVSVQTIQAIVGSSFSGQMATFVDPNQDGPQSPADFAATILWGDGTQSAGLVTQIDGKTFAVNGDHLFTASGTLPLQVIVTTNLVADPVQNGSFETPALSGWQQAGSYLPTDYPWWGHTGSASAYLGDGTYSDLTAGDSTLCQDVTVPAGNSTLLFWTYRYTSSGVGDQQSVQVLDTSGNVLATVFAGLWSDNDWTETSFDLSPFAGQTVRLQFQVSLNGDGQYSYMFLDDVSISRTDKSGTGDGIAQVLGSADTTPPTISLVQINDGNVQRSMVNSVTVAFSEPVMLTGNALQILRRNGSSVPGLKVTAANPSSDQKTWVLTFSGSAVVNGSLPDGGYRLFIPGAAVSDVAGNQLTSDYTQRFFRLYGDYDGNRVVNRSDLIALRQAINQPATAAWWFDYDGNGTVSRNDLLQLRARLRRPLL